MDMSNEALSDIATEVLDIEMQFLVHKNQIMDLKRSTARRLRVKRLLLKIERLLRKAEKIQYWIRIKRNVNDQARLVKAFEIVGVPDGAVNNINDVADILSYALTFSIKTTIIERFEILYAYRVQRQHPISQPAKILVVYMRKRRYRNCILELAGSSPLRMLGSEEPIYFSEHLTYFTRFIFIKAMQMAVEHNIEFVWISKGKIYAQKTANSPRHHIRGEDDVKKMIHY